MKRSIKKYSDRKWFPLALLLVAFLFDLVVFLIFKNIIKQEILNIFSIILHTAVLIYAFKKNTTTRTILVFLVLSYIFKLTYIFLDVYMDLTYVIFNDYIDSTGFQNRALSILNGTMKWNENEKGNYPIFLVYLYKTIGVNRFMAQYLNIMLASVTQLIFLGIGRLLKIEEKKMIFPMFILCFFPLSFPFFSMLIRESIIVFLMVSMFYFFIRWFKEGRKTYVIWTLALFLPAMIMHVGVLALLPAVLFVFAFYDRENKKLRISWKSMIIIGAVFAILVLLFAFSSRIFFDKLGVLKEDALNRIYKILGRDFGGSAYLKNLEYDSIADIFIYSFPRIFYFLFSPVPWAWRGIKDMGAFIIDAMFYLVFIVALIPMYRKTDKDKRFLLAIFIIQFFLFVLFFAQGTFTAGTAMRHRLKSLIIILTIYLLAGDGDVFSIHKHWKNLIKPFTYFIRCKIGRKLSDERYIQLDYRFAMGRKLNLENPMRYTEKIQWLKLNDRKPIYRDLADKYKMREYISQKLGNEYLFPLLGIYDSYDEIDFDKLPNEFVLKPNHTSGDYFLCEDKTTINHKKLKRMIDRWMKRDFYLEHREWQYKDMEVRILCEKFMKDEKYGHPMNYKFFCFNGEPEVLLLATNLGEARTNNFFDIEFNPIKVYGRRTYTDELTKPAVYDKLVDMVRELAKPFLHIRVDAYVIDEKIYFGELTFHHYSGIKKWNPDEYDLELGKKLTLPV